MTHSLYFDLMASNELKATVEIRPTPTRSHDSWVYEITPHKAPQGSYRGTISWKGYDELRLVHAVLNDYYAVTNPLDVPMEEAQ